MGKKALLLGLVLGAVFAFANPAYNTISSDPSPPVAKPKRAVVTPVLKPAMEVVNGQECYVSYGREVCTPYEGVRGKVRRAYITGYEIYCSRSLFKKKCWPVQRNFEVLIPMLEVVGWTEGHPGVIIKDRR